MRVQLDEEVISMAATRPAKRGTKKPRAQKSAPKRGNGKARK
jgi:hypothetical protein